MKLENLTIKDTAKALKNKKISVRELVTEFLESARVKNPEYNAFMEIYNEKEIFADADAAQKKIDGGEANDLTGIPIAVKDNILIEGKIASAASKILENYRATYTATAAKKILDQGGIFIGRTNMDEFAMGGSTENSAFGVTKNAIDTTRVAGGSSGGSATAVAANMVVAALGSDTGGSIRQPASFNGVVGLKPTYGSVSRYGLMAMGSSLDVIGPITKTVEDAEILFNVIKGKDPKDATSVDGGDGFTATVGTAKIATKTKTSTAKSATKSGATKPNAVKKIGVPRSYLKKGIDSDALGNFEKSLRDLQKIGYEIVDVNLPNLDYSLAVYYVLMPAEVSSNMARYDGIRYGSKISGEDLLDDYFKTRGNLLGAEVRRRILLGTYVLSAGYADEYYNKAWQVRNLIKSDLDSVFAEVQAIVLPTTPSPAFKIGEKTSDPLQMYLEDIFTVFANLAGVPAISLPNGFVPRDGKNLPTGLQIVVPHFCENRLFEIGKKFEKIK